MATIVPFGPVQWPPYPTLNSGSPGLTNTGTMNAVGHKQAAIYRGLSGALRQVYIRTGTIAVGGDLDIRIETVSTATGEPTGVLWGANTNVILTVQATDDQVWLVATLIADAVLVPSDVFAIVAVVQNPPGTFQLQGFANANTVGPYRQTFLAAWASALLVPLFIPVLSTGAFVPLVGLDFVGAPTGAVVTFTNAGPPTARGNRFDLVAPVRSPGAWWSRQGTLNGDFSVRLYDTNGTTVLATTGVQSGNQRQTSATAPMFVPWTAGPITLPIASGYRVVLVAENATQSGVFELDVPVASMWNAVAGGAALHRSVLTGGSWVDTPTSRVLMGLVIDGVSDGASSGSLIVEAWQRRRLMPSGPEHQKVKAVALAVEPWQRVEPTTLAEPWAHIWPAAATFEAHQVRQVGA